MPRRRGFYPRRTRQRHGAGILGDEERISYAFHPLAGTTVASTGRRVMCGGVEHVTIRLSDGTLTLTPAWMMRPDAAGFAVCSAPRLCVARLRDLRAYLDALPGFAQGDSPPLGGADHAPDPPPTAGPVRRAGKFRTDPERTPPSHGGDSASAPDRGAFARGLGSDPEGGAS